MTGMGFCQREIYSLGNYFYDEGTQTMYKFLEGSSEQWKIIFLMKPAN